MEEIEEFEKVIKDKPFPLRKIKRNIPKDLEIIVIDCFKFEEEKRYQNFRELKEAIGNFLMGEVVKAKKLILFTSIILIFTINTKNF